MIPVTTLKGKKVALFGLGGSGFATARALVAGGAEVTAWDDNPDSVAKALAEGFRSPILEPSIGTRSRSSCCRRACR